MTILFFSIILLCIWLFFLCRICDSRSLKEEQKIPIDFPLTVLKRNEKATINVGISTILRVNATSMKWLLHNLEKSIALVNLKYDIADLYFHCRDAKQKDFYMNQHAGELWLPFLLQHQAHNKRFVHDQAKSQHPPLFYFIDSRPTMSLDCAKKSGWTELVNEYWAHVLNETQALGLWGLSYNGLEFLLPASLLHMPSSLFPLSSFLTCDFEGTGKYPRDIIIPYVADLVTNTTILTRPNPPREYLLFFASFPVQRVRSELLASLKGLAPDIIIRKNDVPPEEYVDYLQRTKFCLMVVGDTTSSRRLFGNIYHGCIPVIVSDWIVLPFSRFLDYSTFSITIEEGTILTQPTKLIQYLRSIPQSRIEELQAALLEARAVLMYDSSNMLNPVSLVIAEAVLIRVEMCLQWTATSASPGSGGPSSSHMRPICAKLLKRFRGHRSPESFTLRHVAAMFVDKKLA